MEKFLITGFSGFVSRYFLDYLEKNDINAHVLGVDLLSPHFDIRDYRCIKCSFEKVDLLDKNQVDNIIYQFQPEYILHLASYSSVAFSWKDPIASFRNNTSIFLNLLENVRALNLQCRILSVGSSDEYGNVNEDDVPLREDHTLDPVSPYAVARTAQEMFSKVYVEGFGMDMVMTRSFNHIGPMQKDIFAVSSFAKQVVELGKSGRNNGEVIVGNVGVVRDFLDVRDVVAAYYLLFKKGRKGQIYNVCSGRGVTLREIIEKMASIMGMDIKIKINESLIRPNDNRIIIGSNEKIGKDTGWKTTITLEDSLRDILDYWKTRV
jgi:GDP-4-dehydro-6-deoxy-D-mannose reductase